jgi:23S rRNA (uridine2552-2'-O)-methyltransferase
LVKSKNNKYSKADSFALEAKKKGYRSRSALKLIEILKKDELIKKGMQILDLGSYPGGWSQVASEIVGTSGKVFSVDRQPMKQIDNTKFYQLSMQDLFENVPWAEFQSFNLVLSDLAPNISGIREKDDAEMISLLKTVFKINELYLNQKGHLVIKVFQGESFDFAKKYIESNFNKVKIRKPSSSRSNSSETYLLALDKL